MEKSLCRCRRDRHQRVGNFVFLWTTDGTDVLLQASFATVPVGFVQDKAHCSVVICAINDDTLSSLCRTIPDSREVREVGGARGDLSTDGDRRPSFPRARLAVMRDLGFTLGFVCASSTLNSSLLPIDKSSLVSVTSVSQNDSLSLSRERERARSHFRELLRLVI